MHVLILASAILLLLALIFWAKLDAFLALLLASIFTGIASQMPPPEILKSIQNGVGSTLGSLAPVIGLGVILGSLLSEIGAIQVISEKMLQFFGKKRAGLALAITGFTVGIAMFYNAGFVVLAPLVFAVSKSSGQPLVPLAISMAAPLSVTHGFLPPHPGATAVANVFGADLGKTLIFGLAVSVPAILLGAVFFPAILKNIPASPPEGIFSSPENKLEIEKPGLAPSLIFALLPVLLMANSAFSELAFRPESGFRLWAKFFGEPAVSILAAVLSILVFNFFRGKGFSGFKKPVRPKSQNAAQFPDNQTLLKKTAPAIGAAASLFLVIGAGGAFKQVLVDSGLGQAIAGKLTNLPASPLLLGWLVATVLRIAVGSATVAGMTAAGIVQPMISGAAAVSPELMTLAIGAGSLMCSHVNDTGFWMFREWFGLSVRDTFRSWTLMETLVGVVGLLGVLALDLLFF